MKHLSTHLSTTIHEIYNIIIMFSNTSSGGRGMRGRESEYQHDEYWGKRQLNGSETRGTMSLGTELKSP